MELVTIKHDDTKIVSLTETNRTAVLNCDDQIIDANIKAEINILPYDGSLRGV